MDKTKYSNINIAHKLSDHKSCFYHKLISFTGFPFPLAIQKSQFLERSTLLSSSELLNNEIMEIYKTDLEKLRLFWDGHMPTCSISYAWEAEGESNQKKEAYTRWITMLATHLKYAGFNVTLDQWDNMHCGNINRFVDKVTNRNYVFLICTPTLKVKATQEFRVIAAEVNAIVNRINENDQFLYLILKEGEHSTSVPDELLCFPSTDVRIPENYPIFLMSMLRKCMNKENDNQAFNVIRDSLFESLNQYKARAATARDLHPQSAPNELSIEQIQILCKKTYEQTAYIRRVNGCYLNLKESYCNLVAIREHASGTSRNNSTFNKEGTLDSADDICGDKYAIQPEDFFKKHNNTFTKRILVLGRPGIGKSTLCKKICALWQSGELWTDMFDFVFYLNLRDINDTHFPEKRAYTPADIIRELCLQGKTFNQDKLDVINTSQRVLYILDGYDETVGIQKKHYLKTALDSIINNAPFLILTSRPYNVDIPFRDLTIEIIGFPDVEIRSYIQTIFSESDSEQVKEGLIQLICQNPLFTGLSRIPIQLDMLCDITQQRGLLYLNQPGLTRTKLYDLLLDHKLNIYMTKKELDPDNIDDFKKLRASFFNVLGRIAYNSQENKAIEIDANIIMQAMDNGPFTIQDVYDLGIIVPLGKGRLNVRNSYFIHNTFQEYFAAQYIFLKGDEFASNFIKTHRFIPRFQEVLVLLSGIYENSINRQRLNFFTHLFQQPRDLGEHYEMFLACRCLAECNDIEDIDNEYHMVSFLKKKIQSILDNNSLFPDEFKKNPMIHILKRCEMILLQPSFQSIFAERLQSDSERAIDRLFSFIDALGFASSDVFSLMVSTLPLCKGFTFRSRFNTLLSLSLNPVSLIKQVLSDHNIKAEEKITLIREGLFKKNTTINYTIKALSESTNSQEINALLFSCYEITVPKQTVELLDKESATLLITLRPKGSISSLVTTCIEALGGLYDKSQANELLETVRPYFNPKQSALMSYAVLDCLSIFSKKHTAYDAFKPFFIEISKNSTLLPSFRLDAATYLIHVNDVNVKLNIQECCASILKDSRSRKHTINDATVLLFRTGWSISFHDMEPLLFVQQLHSIPHSPNDDHSRINKALRSIVNNNVYSVRLRGEARVVLKKIEMLNETRDGEESDVFLPKMSVVNDREVMLNDIDSANDYSNEKIVKEMLKDIELISKGLPQKSTRLLCKIICSSTSPGIIKIYASNVMKKVGYPSEESANQLVRLIQTQELGGCVTSIFGALETIGRRHSAAIDIAIKFAMDRSKDLFIRVQAAATLGYIGNGCKKEVDAILSLFNLYIPKSSSILEDLILNLVHSYIPINHPILDHAILGLVNLFTPTNHHPQCDPNFDQNNTLASILSPAIIGLSKLGSKSRVAFDALLMILREPKYGAWLRGTVTHFFLQYELSSLKYDQQIEATKVLLNALEEPSFTSMDSFNILKQHDLGFYLENRQFPTKYATYGVLKNTSLKSLVSNYFSFKSDPIFTIFVKKAVEQHSPIVVDGNNIVFIENNQSIKVPIPQNISSDFLIGKIKALVSGD